MGYTENDEDVQIVSELVDDIRDAIIDYRVSGDPNLFLRASSRNPVQTAHQQAIYDQNLELIVSR